MKKNKPIGPNGQVTEHPEEYIRLGLLDVNTGTFRSRVLIGTPMTGLVRAEWVHSRYGQIIPTNWSHVEVCQYFNSFIPLRYQVGDAENLIAKALVEGQFEWLLFIEHDNIIPPQTFIKMNRYMVENKYPVVAGLYFTKSEPPEPMIYREKGWGYFNDWKLGDKVMCAGVPFGCTLIHASLIKAMWNESPEYIVNGQITRRIFVAPENDWADPANGHYLMYTGTTDLPWCERLRKDSIFEKAGWPKFQKMKYPCLVDTSIFCKHIAEDGTQYPIKFPEKFLPGTAVKRMMANGQESIEIKEAQSRLIT